MPATFLGIPRAWRAGVVVGLTAVGLALGLLLPRLAEWALGLPWVPLAGPLRLLRSVPEPWLSLTTSAVGLLAGAWIGVAAIVEALAITVTDQDVTLTMDGKTRRFDRAGIGAVFLDGKQVVLLDRETRELAREKHESTAGEVATGFRKHGYPWSDTDPYESGYRLWVPDLAGLPEGASALLRARSRALEKKQGDETAVLRQELGRLGVVLRDRGNRQYWRRVP